MAARDRRIMSHFKSSEPRAAKEPTAKSKESPGRKGKTTNPVSKKMIRKKMA
jgi:hypothetical protein